MISTGMNDSSRFSLRGRAERAFCVPCAVYRDAPFVARVLHRDPGTVVTGNFLLRSVGGPPIHPRSLGPQARRTLILPIRSILICEWEGVFSPDGRTEFRMRNTWFGQPTQ